MLRMGLPIGVLALLGAGSPAARASVGTAFFLERSTNRNRVVYEVDLARAEPVRPYWQMNETDGHEEALTGLERSRFYGVDVRDRVPGALQFSFRAMPTLAIRVREGNTGPEAFVEILGVERRVRRIFLRLRGALFPSLAEAEFDCADGEYRFVPDDGGHWRRGERRDPDLVGTQRRARLSSFRP